MFECFDGSISRKKSRPKFWMRVVLVSEKNVRQPFYGLAALLEEQNNALPSIFFRVAFLYRKLLKVRIEQPLLWQRNMSEQKRLF